MAVIDLDVALPDGCGDADYLAALEQALQLTTYRVALSYWQRWQNHRP